MKDEGRTCQPLASPFFVMAKPIGATCNLHCSYCYYLEKDALYAPAQQAVMSDQLLDDSFTTISKRRQRPLCFSHGMEENHCCCHWSSMRK